MKIVRWISLSLIVIGIVLLARALPLENAVGALQAWIQSLGVWGPLAFALIYAVWAVLFLPGSALTLAGGAIFGLGWGFVTVLIGATLGAALAFLIARYGARDRVAKMAANNPKFAAVDRAVGEGGWKIVAMLRLSPAIPFNLQNYLYGLTSIRFWACVLTSFVFMAPGTFLYVYLGHLGAQGLAAAGGGDTGRTPAEWTMLTVGLLATVAVTAYVTRLANRALKSETAVEEAAQQAGQEAGETAAEPKSPWGVVALATVAVVVFGSALYAYTHRDAFKGLFGPPAVTLQEAYEENPSGPRFDHSGFDALLKEYVDGRGLVDYAALRNDANRLNRYLASIETAPFDEMGRDEKLALLINAYNAFTLRLILDYYPIDSIMSIPSEKRWDDPRWSVGGHRWSLNQIEHEQIRPKFREPRIHFALVCAAIGCPKLRVEAYAAARLDEQLEDQALYTHSHEDWFSFDAAEGVVRLTQLYNWYGGDFRQIAGSVLAYAAQYSPELRAAVERGKKPEIEWLDYDWSLNVQRHVASGSSE